MGSFRERIVNYRGTRFHVIVGVSELTGEPWCLLPEFGGARMEWRTYTAPWYVMDKLGDRGMTETDSEIISVVLSNFELCDEDLRAKLATTVPAW